MRPYTKGRLDRYRIGIPRELSEIRTQPWLSEGSLTWHVTFLKNNNKLIMSNILLKSINIGLLLVIISVYLNLIDF